MRYQRSPYLATTCRVCASATGRYYGEQDTHLLSVINLVQVPLPNGGAIVDTQDIDVLDFKTSCFNLPDDPPKRAGGISTWEDILVHEETPKELLTQYKNGGAIRTK
jgi:hypothetical protein